MRHRLAALATTALLAISPLAQAGGPFQSELLHLDLPLMSASAGATAKTAAAQPAAARSARAEAAAAATLPARTRAEVIAELREARARGEMDFASAELGLPIGSVRSTMLAGKSRDAVNGEAALGQR